MSPCFPTYNCGNRSTRDAEKRSEFAPRNPTRRVPPADFADLFLRQFCAWASFSSVAVLQARGVGMADVLGTSDPFQIENPVVSLDTVDVIDFVVGGTWPQERPGNQAVGQISYWLSVTTKIIAGITIMVESWPQDETSVSTMTTRFHPAHSSQAGHLVPAFVANNRTPFFGGCARVRIHRKGRSFRCHAAGGPRLAAALIITREVA